MGTPVVAVLQMSLSAVELLTNVPSSVNPTIAHGENSTIEQLTSDGLIPISGWSAQTIAIPGAGSIDVDLTALPTAQGTGTVNTKRPRAVVVLADAANVGAITLATNITNGYTPLAGGQAIVVGADGYDLQYIPPAIAAVGASSKLIRISGASGDKCDLGILWG